VIVGGGVVGSTVAYFLAAEPGFQGRIVVVEPDPTYADSSTARSVASVRQQFSLPENIRISKYAIEFLNSIHEHLTVDGETPDVGFHEGGYLFLASDAGRATLEANHRTQVAEGAPVAMLAPAELKDRFPWLAVDDLAAGTLGLEGEGWLDPYALLQGFKRKARSLGVAYVEDRVVGMVRDGNRVAAVRLAGGDTLSSGLVVNAAGPRAAEAAAMAGIELPVRPRKRCVFVFRCREALPRCPLVIDPSGLYFRPEGQVFLTGISPAPDDDPDCLDLEVDYRVFEETLWPILARRVPAFEAIKLERAWAGHYAYNTVDQNAILGPHPAVGNFYFANGFSGHGLQQAPAVGRALSELITFGAYRTLDLSRFSYARFAACRPVRELNVV
jgi:sarcosine oxidase